ncbi:M20 family metallopeptidase [Alicyclobacillus fastidiosus]|uniref:M20 family metallopeptidase n=1 Tax=Alicyclobacillus fastidiosus TaxID=392011 RepID=A0ABV5AJU1_9BACL|nr:M20 family metallopeptidase [Alicyclobacillus fastidiosus]WEH09045.1 M20 family metallopeptidase [Alicyclobacillus fastidiosus]
MSGPYEYLQSHEREIIASLKELVLAESPTRHKELVDSCGATLTKLFQQHLGLEPEVIPQSTVGNHLKFSYGSGEAQLLILAHFDTVWQPGRLGYRVDGDRIFGPGVLDMKGGLIQALWALKSLKDLNVALNKKIVVLCNSDEEIGSPTSRSLIEEEARKSQAVFVVEPAEANSGALKTARKGVSMYRLNISGRSAHAGNHHEGGVSAVLELARQIEFLEGLTDYEVGTTLNVGVAKGGTQSNVVPEHAEAHVDVRTVTLQEAKRVANIMANLKPTLEGATVSVSGGINRPPMERTEHTARLYQVAKEIAHRLRFELPEALVGGGSDGNFTAALGVPTLDGLGAVGDGPHAEYEHIYVPALTQRSGLLAELLMHC